MNETVGSLLSQGLIMTALGMGLVFAALALLWGLMRLLTEVFRDKAEATAPEAATQAAALTTSTADAMAVAAQQAEQLTAERAHVAALVAGALLANALPLGLEPPVGPTFEHGRTAPAWVAGNRSHALQRWQPQRRPESYPPRASEY